MRGTGHNSAAIARIGDVDTQFSHVAIIYIDPAGTHGGPVLQTFTDGRQ